MTNPSETYDPSQLGGKEDTRLPQLGAPCSYCEEMQEGELEHGCPDEDCTAWLCSEDCVRSHMYDVHDRFWCDWCDRWSEHDGTCHKCGRTTVPKVEPTKCPACGLSAVMYGVCQECKAREE